MSTYYVSSATTLWLCRGKCSSISRQGIMQRSRRSVPKLPTATSSPSSTTVTISSASSASYTTSSLSSASATAAAKTARVCLCVCVRCVCVRAVWYGCLNDFIYKS